MRYFLPALLLLALAGCRPDAPAPAPSSPDTLETPAAPGSRAPRLSSHGGRLLLSWLEPAGGDTTALRFSAYEGGAWTAPRTVTAGPDLLVNGADTPSVVPLPGGGLAAHWLVRGPGNGYSLRTARSADGGTTWTAPAPPHRDATATEHGFAQVQPWNGAQAGIAWLDGRAYAGDGAGQTALRFATLAPDGTPGAETVLDDRTCDCCPTAAALTADGPLVAYRDRGPEEIRDIAVVRFADGAWTAPRIVHADGWRIDGCPVNGPALAAQGRRVAVAWFTLAGEAPHVRLAFSTDAGATFGPPVEVSEGQPLGRVAVALGGDGVAHVLYLDGPTDDATLRLRRVHTDGTRETPVTMADGLDARATGFPVLARHADALVLAWTTLDRPGGVPVIRTARYPLAPAP